MQNDDKKNTDKNADGKLQIPDGYKMDAKGNLVHGTNIKAQRLLEDETVEKIFGYGKPLREQIARFRCHTQDDLDSFMDLLDQEYGVKRGGAKGNASFTTFDGLKKVSISKADTIDFGAELQTAKTLFDQIVHELGNGINPAIMSLVETAFSVGKAGRINRENLFKVRDLEIEHPLWEDFRRAVNDSIRIIANKTYIRLHQRTNTDSEWEVVSLDIANA